MSHDLRLQIVEFLPRLRRFSQALTGDKDKGDDLVQETCARAVAGRAMGAGDEAG
jgi:RNA polymerase sigma-70 factor, ECF subfamily